MLVLLIIFIITVPVIKHAVNIDLPQASHQKLQDKPQNIRLAVAADGSYFWNDTRVADADLPQRLIAAAAQEPQPELHIRGDRAVRYERVAQALAAAQRAGVRKIGFITEPANP
jgi:biopolymer transport protein ExbD